ncbi:hypothetical protein F4808DRAFT_103730 [Astrocystis sublimbata]|nr:hypothetical protein F4808DRAFT_103730 [Astrocystis sublimbata]
MATQVNSTGRPNLAPIWTSYKIGERPSTATAFRAAHAPLLSPSPVSPTRLPSPMYLPTSDNIARKKDKTLGDSRVRKATRSGLSSPRLHTSIEGQSPLVHKLEKVSLQLASLRSPVAVRGDRFRPVEDFDNAATADAFIFPRSIIRNEGSPISPSRPFWEDHSPGTKLTNHHLTLRAVIQPKAPWKPMFAIQRTYDLDEVRTSVPMTPPYHLEKTSSPTRASRKPLPVPAKWSNSRRPSAALPSPIVDRSEKVSSHAAAAAYDKVLRDPKTVPIHILYIKSCLPVLYLLLTDGFIQSGDVVYLPVPHAEAWLQTLRYVYTGEGELTVAVLENILYLGGKV